VYFEDQNIIDLFNKPYLKFLSNIQLFKGLFVFKKVNVKKFTIEFKVICKVALKVQLIFIYFPNLALCKLGRKK